MNSESLGIRQNDTNHHQHPAVVPPRNHYHRHDTVWIDVKMPHRLKDVGVKVNHRNKGRTECRNYAHACTCMCFNKPHEGARISRLDSLLSGPCLSTVWVSRQNDRSGSLIPPRDACVQFDIRQKYSVNKERMLASLLFSNRDVEHERGKNAKWKQQFDKVM